MKPGVWRRRFAVAAIVSGVGYWLFADTVAYYLPAARDPGAIRFAHFGTYQDYETWKNVIAAFEAQNPRITVRQEYVSGWYGLYHTKIREQMLAGDLPHVMLVQAGPFLDLAEGFADLTSFIDSADDGFDLSQLDATGVQSFRHRGRLRGLPVSGGNLLIYCNPDCFNRASAFRGRAVNLPPDDWTLGDFRALAEALTCDFDGDGQPDQFGFWQPRWVYYLPFLWSFGADVLDSAGTQWRLTGPEAEAAFAFYQDMRFRDRISPHPYETAQIMQDVGFLTGKVAMCVNGP